MDTSAALEILGLEPGATASEVRAAYLRLVREHHPDLAGQRTTRFAARLNDAYATLVDRGTSPQPEPNPDPSLHDDVDAPGDEQAILLGASPVEAFTALFDAAGRIGHVASFDPHNGIIETVVRFAGGPSCSLLITIVPGNEATRVDLALESIEATPTPPVAPVLDALVRALGEHR